MINPEYSAGFFDGEGCVNITVHGKNRQASLRVMITNTDENILKLFQLNYGGFLSKPRIFKKGWKHFRMLVLNGKKGIDFLKIIYPYSILKQNQIKLAFEFWNFQQLPQNERCQIVKTPTDKAPWHITMQRKSETIIKEFEFKDKMHFLNTKGLN